jgi:peptide/nickel transport system permease protein
MVQYTIRRILYAIPVLLAILTVTFMLARLIPGDPCRAILGEKATAAVCEQFTRDFGLDKPIIVQFGIYMRDLMRGDLGNSIRFGRPVSIILIERLPVTIELGLTAMIIAVLIGIPAGILAAVRRNSAVDVFTMIGANIGVSIPVFFLGLILIYIFAVFLAESFRRCNGFTVEIVGVECVPDAGRIIVTPAGRAPREPYQDTEHEDQGTANEYPGVIQPA